MPTVRPRSLVRLVPWVVLLLSVGCGGGGSDDQGDAGLDDDGAVLDGATADPDASGDAGNDDGGVDAFVPTAATLAADDATAPLGELIVDTDGPVDVVIRNVGGSVSGTLTTTLVGDASFSITSDTCDGTTLDPAESCTVHVVARSASTATGNATVSVVGLPGGTAETAISVAYVTPFELELDDVDAAHDFGSRLVGGTATKVVRVTNVGGQRSPALATLQTTNAAYAITADGCSGATIAATAFCEFTITYAPTAPGATSSTTTVSAGTTSLPLVAEGLAQSPAALRLEASAASFPATLLGEQSITITYALWNDGDVDSGTIATAITGSDAGQFEIVTDDCDGEIVAPDTHRDLTVRFTPNGTRGAKQASVTATGSPGGTASATLDGTALADAVFTESAGPHGFGVETVGGISASHEFLVMNGGDVSSGAVAVTLGGTDPGQFAIGTGSCASPVAAESGCSVHVTFRPTRFGAASATITVTGTPGGTVGFDVTGTGEDTLFLALDLPFGGGGAGSVTGGGIDCPSGLCSASFSRTSTNPSVTLTASPAASSTFAGWTGACASFGTASACTLALDDAWTSVGVGFDLKVYDVVLLVNGIEGTKGTVTSTSSPTSGAEFDCGSTCQVSVTHGTTIDLVATPESGAYFGGFDGGCVATGHTCSFTVTESTEIEVVFTPANRTFTTSLTYTIAELKSLATDTTSEATRTLSGADERCRAISGSNDYYAFLGAVGVSPYTRIPGAPRGFVRADGRPFKGELSHTSPVYYPPSLDQGATPVSNVTASTVWSGVGSNGLASASTTCSDWTTSGTVAIGPYEGVGTTWSSNASSSCNTTARHHLVCLQAKYQADVTPDPVPVGARRAFVSHGIFDPATGLDGADDLCQAEASGALPGTYLAVLATSSETMGSRFALDTRPIHRLDGVYLAPSAASLFGATLPLAPISLDADGHTIQALVFTGSADPSVAGTTATTCYTAANGSWSTNASGVNGTYGFSSQRDLVYTGYYFPCNWGQGHVYCLEE